MFRLSTLNLIFIIIICLIICLSIFIVCTCIFWLFSLRLLWFSALWKATFSFSFCLLAENKVFFLKSVKCFPLLVVLCTCCWLMMSCVLFLFLFFFFFKLSSAEQPIKTGQELWLSVFDLPTWQLCWSGTDRRWFSFGCFLSSFWQVR